ESAASGLLAGINAAAMATGQMPSAPPRTTAIGALAFYASHANPAHYAPSNITFGIMEPMDARSAEGPPGGGRGKARPLSKLDKKLSLANRALNDLAICLRRAAA